jgi:hypothetical protein
MLRSCDVFVQVVYSLGFLLFVLSSAGFRYFVICSFSLLRHADRSFVLESIVACFDSSECLLFLTGLNLLPPADLSSCVLSVCNMFFCHAHGCSQTVI